MAAAKSASGPDDIMSAADMKPLLALSKREPVSAAIGITADKLGVVLLHKMMRPKKVMATLRADAKKIRLGLDGGSLRFGTAEVDPEIDGKLVLFRINKEAPGVLAVKVRDHLKKAGFAKVEFVVDPSLEEEGEEDEAAAPGEAARAAAVEPDWAGLTTTLTGLVKSIAASGRQAVLVPLAAAANAAVKGHGDFAAAQAVVDALRQGLEAKAAPFDAKALSAELAALMHKIAAAAGGDAARRASLIGLAGDANAKLKAADPAAADAIAQLRDVIVHPAAKAEAAIDWAAATKAWSEARGAANAAAGAVIGELNLLAPGTAAGVQNVLDSYGKEMAGLLQKAGRGPAPRGVALIRGSIAGLRSEMAGDEMFAYLEQNGVKVRPAFLDGFARIEAVIGSATA